MKLSKLAFAISILTGAAAFSTTPVLAQQAQIPTLQVCNETAVEGNALVFIAARQDALHSGIFTVRIELRCDPSGNGYPVGALEMEIDMSDSTINGALVATTFEQVTTTGKHTPTTYLNGRCKAENVEGCRYWMVLADNKDPQAHETPDVVGFLVFDGLGNRVAYGTGPVAEGDVRIAPTSN